MQLTSPNSRPAAGPALALQRPAAPRLRVDATSRPLRHPRSQRSQSRRHVEVMAFGEDRRVDRRRGGGGLLKTAGMALAGLVGVSVLGSSLLAVGVAMAGISFAFTVAAAAFAIVAPVGFFVWGIVKGLLLLTLLLAGGVAFFGYRTFNRMSAGKREAVAQGEAPLVEERGWEQQERAVSREMDELARLQQQELADFDKRLNGDSLSDFDRRLRGRDKERSKEPFEL